MKIALWVLAGIGALVVLGGVVIPLVSWLLGTLGWVLAGVAVIGGGLWLARSFRDEPASVEPVRDPRPLL